VAQIGLISGNIAGSGCERWPRRPTRPKLSTVVEAAQEQAQADPVRGWQRRRLLVCLADREDLAVARR